VVKQFTTQTDPMILLAVSAAYLVLYYFISLRKFQTDDL
jgi:hypothetical protein